MDKIKRETEIHRSMTPHQMALRIVELEDESAAAIKAMSAAREAIAEGTAKLEEYNAKLDEYDKRIAELQDALELAEEAVRARHSPGAGKIAPDGWQLVPVEPTQKMLDAWPEQPDLSCDFMNNRNCAYRAMLSAAPKLGGE